MVPLNGRSSLPRLGGAQAGAHEGRYKVQAASVPAGALSAAARRTLVLLSDAHAPQPAPANMTRFTPQVAEHT